MFGRNDRLISFFNSKKYLFCFFNDTATTEIYTLSLHDALPIYRLQCSAELPDDGTRSHGDAAHHAEVSHEDRKSTRLNSSHPSISYAVFCLKKKICFIPLLSFSFFMLKLLLNFTLLIYM